MLETPSGKALGLVILGCVANRLRTVFDIRNAAWKVIFEDCRYPNFRVSNSM